MKHPANGKMFDALVYVGMTLDEVQMVIRALANSDEADLVLRLRTVIENRKSLNCKTKQAAIEAWIASTGIDGFTARDVEQHLGLYHRAVPSVLNNLYIEGVLVKREKTRRNKYGHHAQVFVASDVYYQNTDKHIGEQ